jgi:hypothetical protein
MPRSAPTSAPAGGGAGAAADQCAERGCLSGAGGAFVADGVTAQPVEPALAGRIEEVGRVVVGAEAARRQRIDYCLQLFHRVEMGGDDLCHGCLSCG